MRGKVEVIVAIVFVGSLPLLRQLSCVIFSFFTGDMLDVLLHTWSCIEGHVHDIQGRFTSLLVELIRTSLLCLGHIR